MNSNTDSRTLTSMLKLEENYILAGDYFNATIRPEMRSKLATWMLEVCEEQECTDDVYATAMNIFDRLMSALTNQVEVYHLQLLGSVCLFIASKLSATPSKLTAAKLIDYTDNSISLEDLLEWELFTMDKLRWDVCSIVPNEFIDILIQSIHLKHDLSIVKKHCYAFTAMCATDYKFSKYPSSLIASACILKAVEGLDAMSNCQSNLDRLVYHLNSLVGIDVECLLMVKDQVDVLFQQSAETVEEAQAKPDIQFEDDYDFNIEFNMDIEGNKKSEGLAKTLILSPASTSVSSSSSSLSPSLFMNNSSYYTNQEMVSMMMITPPNANSLPMPEFDCFGAGNQDGQLRRSSRLIKC